MDNLKDKNKLNTAVILAGGKSSRMGFDKQLIKIDDRYLMELLVEALSSEFEEIVIISNDHSVYKDMHFHANVVIEKDIISGKGPLCGLYSALHYSSSDYIFLIACDMPYINIDYIRYLKSKVEENPDTAAVVTEKGQWVEPFYGFYSRELMDDIITNIESDNLKILNLLRNNKTIYIKETEARRFSKSLSIFENLNTIKDIERFKANRLLNA